MSTVRCTMAQALVRYLCNQFTIIDGKKEMLFPGVFAIFGHGNVTCLSEALEAVKDTLPTWRGQNEQSMALAAIGFAKAKRRRQIMVATSSIGPGALNMVTAAGVAHSNRLPVLLLSGDTFVNRRPDPVMQQVEHFGDPTINVNDAFKRRDALLGPHHPPGADHLVAAAGGRCHARSGRLRPGLHRAAAGRAGNRLGLSGGLLRANRPCHPAPARRPGSSGAGARHSQERQAPADHFRRRRALFRRRGGSRRVRDGARHPGCRDHRRQGRASRTTIRPMSARSASSARPRPMRSRPRPMSSWPSARA